MAFCGSTCSITAPTEMIDATVEGHTFTINFSSNEIDVRSFGSGAYGDWIACNQQGTISVNSYERPALDINESVTFTANVGSEVVSGPAIVTGQDITVDAKGVGEFVTNLRIEGAITIT